MDWIAATLQPLNTNIPFTSFESLLKDEQKVYSKYVPQRILEEL
jgi:hypothetical protein